MIRVSSDSQIVWFCVILALVMRVLFYPDTLVRDVDETGYVRSGMMLAEGLTPTYKAAPAAPQVWLSWACVMAISGRNLLQPADAERMLPAALKPYGAVNAALFDFYRDQTPLRRAHLFMVVAFGLLAVWAAARLGQFYGGQGAALLLGGTIAVAQVFVSFSLMTRPYICGWALALTALLIIVRADQARSFSRALVGFVVLGLAVGSRIEMLTVLPLAWWTARHFLKANPFPIAPKLTSLAILTAATACTALFVAPWLVTSLITNLKSIVAVRAVGVIPTSVGEGLYELIFEAGCGILLLLALIGVLRTFISSSLASAIALVVCGGGPILMAVKGSGFGIHHDGGALVCSVFLAAIGCQWLAIWNRKILIGAAIFSIGIGGIYTIVDRGWREPISTDAPVSAWLEANIKPGARIIYAAATRVLPLPTSASADAMWSECATTAWLDKYQSITRQLTISSSSEFPRALSIDNMTKEYSAYRSWFILGGRQTLSVPRFDIYPTIGLNMRANIDPLTDYQQHDAVYVLSTGDVPPTTLGTPLKLWGREFGLPTYIFAKPQTLMK